MNFRIIADSCCDLTPQLKEKMQVLFVPLTLRLGNREYVDDDTLNLPEFMENMLNCTEKIGSAAPAPHLYQSAAESAGESFIVTLSSRLSASYQSAMVGKGLAEEKGNVSAHVFDSKSASAGETLIVMKIHELIMQGLPKERIIAQVTSFIDKMKTYFVLENHDNLRKNGRLSRITSTIVGILHIKLVMGSDGDGNIALYGMPRGTKQMIDKLLQLIRESGKKTEHESLVITHCYNPNLAERLAAAIREQFNFKEVFVIPTAGLSSLYTDDKGIVMAF